MNGYFGIDPKLERGSSKLRLSIVIIGVAILLVFAIGIGIIHVSNNRLSRVLTDFTQALEDREYSKALRIYREIHESIVRVNPDRQQSVQLEKQVLSDIESVVQQRVTRIMTQIRYERYVPSADDRAFLEGLEELTGARLSTWLDDLAREYLLGSIEKPTIVFIFDQISDYSNVSATTGQLKNELSAIELFRGDVQLAENYFSQKNYIEAAKQYEYILSMADGYVMNFSEARLATLKEEMYDPIMKQTEQLIENFNYYTAEEILSEMIRIFPDDARVQNKLLEATSNTSLLEPYVGSVEVICVKPLIADEEVAFSSSVSSSVDAYNLTRDEFSSILESLYDKNYVLVNPEDMVDLTNPIVLQDRALYVPQGKKPLVIILENFNYSAYQMGQGFCSRLVINDQNQVSGEFVNISGQTVISRTAEAIGILDAFVEEHPDFSYNGQKGIISFSGYESVFGYIIHEDQIDDRNNALTAVGQPTISLSNQEILDNQNKVINIISRLNTTGWVFASSTYGYINANSCEQETIENDTQKWINQISPIVGPVNILVYPNGDFIKGSDPRCVYLKNNGFRIFFGVGPTPYYIYGDNYLYFDRAVLNGDTIRNVDYSRLFDAKTVYDENRKIPF
ncbi:MAG: hypothetical protein GXY06_01700 [Clostridiaceae bacterium]|nr:hypothetical protein [Clostridiaceae bacterium]